MVPSPPPTAQPHRDAAYRFVVGAAYFAVISLAGSLAAVLFGSFGVLVSILVSLVGVYYGGIEVARGVDLVVRYALSEQSSDGASAVDRPTTPTDASTPPADEEGNSPD